MAAELLRLGLLDDQQYHMLLKKLINDTEFSVITCEILIKAVEAKEGANKSSVDVSQDVELYNLYQELLEHCLLPRLHKIIGNYSYAVQNNHYLLPHVRDAEKNKSSLLSLDDLLSQDHNLNDQELEESSDKLLRDDELILVPKLSRIIVVIMKMVSGLSKSQIHTGNSDVIDGDSLDKKSITSLKTIFEGISQNLPVRHLDAVVDEEHHKVKVLSLIFANLLKDGWCLRHCSLRRASRIVLDVSLAVIKASPDADITALLLMLIIQPFLDFKNDDKNEVIHKLWHIVKNFYIVDGNFITVEKNTTGFLILCFMATHMFEDGCFSLIGGDDILWKIIQFGLVHTNPLSRKRCQYVLKRSVDYFSSESITKLKSEYISWPRDKNDEVIRFWNDFFLLVESLEEKQAHVVRPVLEKLDHLINMCCSTEHIFHISWTLVIFKRIFDQDNKNIKQWGLMKILRLKLSQEVLVKGVLFFVRLHVLPALSDYCLYSRDAGQRPRTPSTVGDQLVLFLENIIVSLDVTQQKYFMCSLLETLFDGRAWGGIPLFYLIRGLSLMPKTAVWSFKVVKSAVSNFEGCLSTQEVVLRSASQCDLLKAVFKHLVPEVTFLEICDIVGHFRRKESWCRGTVLWNTIIKELDTFQETWQNRFLLIELAINKSLSSSETIHPHDIALGVNLLLDSNSLPDDVPERSCVIALLNPLSNFLRDCHIRPYLDHKKLTWVMEMLTQTLEIFTDVPSDCPQRPDKSGKHVSCLVEGIDCIAQLFIREIRRYNQPYDIEIISHYLSLFTQCRNLENLKDVLNVHYPELLQVCHVLLGQDNAVKNAFGVLLLEHLLAQYYGNTSSVIKEDMMNLVYEKVICNIEKVTPRRQIDGYNSTEFTSKLLLETTRSRWCCVWLLVQQSVSLKEEEYVRWRKIKTATISALPSAANAAGTMNVLLVFQLAVSLSPSIIENGMWEELTKVMWDSSREFRKGCDLYRSLIGCVTDLLFYEDAITKPECHGFIIQMSQWMRVTGIVVQGIASHMSRSLVTSLVKIQKKALVDPTPYRDIIQDILVPLLMFGSVFRKQYKVIHDTTEFIQDCGRLYSTNSLIESDHDADSRARAIALRYLLTLDKEKPKDRNWALVVAEGIKTQYTCCTGERRDFANSQKHRYKTRLLQAFLLILPLLDKSECSKDLAWLCKGLIKDHQQPSVRYLQEWGVSLITILHPQLFPDLLSHFLQRMMRCCASLCSTLYRGAWLNTSTPDCTLSSQSPLEPPLDSCPTTPLDICPTTPLDSCPTTPPDSCPTTPLDSCPTTPLDSCPTTPLDSCPTTPPDCPTTPLDSCPTTPLRRQLPHNSTDSCPTTPLDSCPTTPPDSCPTTPLDSCPTTPPDSCPTTNTVAPQLHQTAAPQLHQTAAPQLH
ncbi:methyltransferase TARBP1-like 1 [Homarus americanus]|uniref:Methyltransferase TARBP1-like 1 n=1 Tax=Homarus americanus TaxID=6706 RepID=A0A8J5N5F6_HOMAM|nr:methyltransferase TARBP1-like 1 [Homarus americanus]